MNCDAVVISATVSAMELSHIEARISGLYSHIATNHWMGLLVGTGCDLFQAAI